MERPGGTSGGSDGRNDTLVEHDHDTIDDGTVLHWYGIRIAKFHLDIPSLIAPKRKARLRTRWIDPVQPAQWRLSAGCIDTPDRGNNRPARV